MNSTHSLGNQVSVEHRTDEQARSETRGGCPECDGHVVHEANEQLCRDCGLVVGTDRLDRGRDWVGFDETDDDPRRTGAPMTEGRHDRGLSTEIGRFRAGTGNGLSGSKRRQLARLRRAHKRGKFESKADRNLAHGCTEIARIVGALGLSRGLREQASALFRSAQSAGLLPGRSVEAFAAASVYAACRCAGVVRPIERIAEVARVEKSRVRNSYDVMNVELGLATMVQRPSDMVPWIASECDVPDRVRQRALELARVAEEKGIANGCRPSGVAAGCLYRAADEAGAWLTQGELADAAGVSAVTVRTHWEALAEVLEG